MKASRILLLMLSAVCTSASAQVILNTSVWLPPNHPTVAGMTIPLCADIEKVTEKRVQCKLLPKPVVAPPQTLDAVRNGVADLSFIVDGYNPGRFVLSSIAEFPFMGANAEINSVAYQRVYDKYLKSANEHQGVKVLAVFTHGPGQLYTVKQPITDLTDLHGLKIRTGGGLVSDVVKSLGGTGMLKSAPEVYELVSGGIIDGFVFPKETVESLRLIPLIKHAMNTPGGIYNVSFTFVMNPAKWSQIAAADQKQLEKLFGEPLARRCGKAWDEADLRGEAAMRAAGINIREASPKMRDEIRTKTAHLEDQWYAKVKAKGVDGKAAMTAMRAEIAKLTPAQ